MNEGGKDCGDGSAKISEIFNGGGALMWTSHTPTYTHKHSGALRLSSG